MALSELEREALTRLELRVARWRVARWCLLAVGALFMAVPIWFIRPSDLEPIFSKGEATGADLYFVYVGAVLASISFWEFVGGLLLIIAVLLKWRGNPVHILVVSLARDSAGGATNQTSASS